MPNTSQGYRAEARFIQEESLVDALRKRLVREWMNDRAVRSACEFVSVHSLDTVNAVIEDTCMRRTAHLLTAEELHRGISCGLAG